MTVRHITVTEAEVADLDRRMMAVGMIPLSTMMKGSAMDRFLTHAQVHSLDDFEQWLVMRRDEMMRMRANYIVTMKETGTREEDQDAMLEWVFSHEAVLNEVLLNYRQAINK